MKKIIIIRTSPHRGGNTDLLADEFRRGAEEMGHEVEDIKLSLRKINYCYGCYGTSNPKSCTRTGTCWQQDDVNDIVAKMRETDIVVFASPVYFYSLSGQMKVFLDRTVQIYGAQYRFRDIYFLSAAESGSRSAMDASLQSLQGWMDCMPGTRLAGVVRGTGVLAPGSIKNHASVMAEAYEMGKKV